MNDRKSYRWFYAILATPVLVLISSPGYGHSGVELTKHNLTATGSTASAAQNADTGVCGACHTPHHAASTLGLWSGNLPGVTYTLYQSSTLQASPGQPTGSSRLCLSCHDGILAAASGHAPGASNPTMTEPLSGANSLGTDLSDDHPVSFVYDNDLAAAQGELADPATLPPTTPLDHNKELQCTTCHDPHEDGIPNFLRVDNQYGALCTTCHKPESWNDSVHATSIATWQGTGTNPWPADAFPSVAENACGNCHRSHAAAHPEWLLAHSDEAANCTSCHDGSLAQKNILTEFNKPFHHPVETGQWIHKPHEDPLTMPRHVSCDDCHNPHSAAQEPSGTTQTVAGSQRHVSGVTIGGVTIGNADYKYEICLKCHGEQEPVTAGFLRADSTRNIRLRIDPANASFHPVAAEGKNPGITGLKPEFTAASRIDCTDCHDNDAWSAGSDQPRGPHGSNYQYILARQYQTGDPVIESYDSYALCYSCHDRNTLLQPPVGSGFPHNTHVVDDQASCAACHDAHGSRNNPFLVDFMTKTMTGADVVTPTASGRLEFVPGSPGHGTCYLSCHGHPHEGSSY